MSYWNNEVDGCDYAFDAVGVYILNIKKLMFSDMDAVISKRYPEQSIAATVCLLRHIGERFPQIRDVFGRQDLERARNGFRQWFELTKEKLPIDRRDAIYFSAEEEFGIFEERFLTRRKPDTAGNL